MINNNQLSVLTLNILLVLRVLGQFLTPIFNYLDQHNQLIQNDLSFAKGRFSERWKASFFMKSAIVLNKKLNCI